VIQEPSLLGGILSIAAVFIVLLLTIFAIYFHNDYQPCTSNPTVALPPGVNNYQEENVVAFKDASHSIEQQFAKEMKLLANISISIRLVDLKTFEYEHWNRNCTSSYVSMNLVYSYDSKHNPKSTEISQF